MTDRVDTPEAEKDASTVDDGMSGVPEPLATAMRKRGFSDLTSVQRAVLDAESDGRDLRISSQTGSGKTVAIGLALKDLLASLKQLKSLTGHSTG